MFSVYLPLPPNEWSEPVSGWSAGPARAVELPEPGAVSGRDARHFRRVQQLRQVFQLPPGTRQPVPGQTVEVDHHCAIHPGGWGSPGEVFRDVEVAEVQILVEDVPLVEFPGESGEFCD